MIVILKKRHFASSEYKHILTSFLYEFTVAKSIIVCDIHNTIEYDEGKIDATLFEKLKKAIDLGTLVIFLSYDTRLERMKKNAQILDSYSGLLKRCPKIFIKKREKGDIVKLICDYFKPSYLLFIDDKTSNIKDVQRKVPFAEVIHYTEHHK